MWEGSSWKFILASNWEVSIWNETIPTICAFNIGLSVADVCLQALHTVDMQTWQGPGIFQFTKILATVSASV